VHLFGCANDGINWTGGEAFGTADAVLFNNNRDGAGLFCAELLVDISLLAANGLGVRFAALVTTLLTLCLR